MNLLWNVLRDFRDFFRPAPSGLRNRANGMAWIKLPCDEGNGTYDLHRRIVKTVRHDGAGYWQIDPPQEFLARGLVLGYDAVALPGWRVVVPSIHDDLLEPIRDVGDEERSQELAFQPKVPAGARQGETA